MRRIDFEGCFNFRDLGGWRTIDGRSVRWRRLFRADSVHLMSPRDVERATAELGIRTLIDLRGEAEVALEGIGELARRGVRRIHLPLWGRPAVEGVQEAAGEDARGVPSGIDSTVGAGQGADRSPDAMAPAYLGILERSAPLLVALVEALADPGSLPAVIFCLAGKDRTGLASALVLGALGVRDEDIIEDYVLTGAWIDAIIRRFAARPDAPPIYRELEPSAFAPYAETMERVMAALRVRYGSEAAYLEAKGLAPETLERLRDLLLE